MRVIQLEHPAILNNLLSDMYVRKEQHAGSTFSFEQTLALSSILSYIMGINSLSNCYMLFVVVFGKYPFEKDTKRNMY